MPNQSDGNPKDLVFILAIAGRIDAQSRLLAKNLQDNYKIHHAYAVLDSLSSSYSMYKYFFDICAPKNDTDSMHEAMMTPGGIAAITLETLFLVGFSLFASIAEKEISEKEAAEEAKKESTYNPLSAESPRKPIPNKATLNDAFKEYWDYYKPYIAAYWPYFRDVMKGLKNAYKGWRSAIQAAVFLGGMDLRYLIMPVGIALGVFAATNRLFLRNMLEARKGMMTHNKKLLLKIQNEHSLTEKQRQDYLEDIKSQSQFIRKASFIQVALGGFIDGLYLYVGVLGLAVLSTPLFIAMASLCAMYTIGCIITRIYEEYDFQQRLVITQFKCKLVLLAKQMDTLYSQILTLQAIADKTNAQISELKQLKKEWCSLFDESDDHRLQLQVKLGRTYFMAFLQGIKDALYAYSSTASVLFMFASILTLSGTVFPPALLMAVVSCGALFMIVFTAYSIRTNYLYQSRLAEKQTEDRPYQKLVEMKKNIDLDKEEELLDTSSFKTGLQDGFCFDVAPQFFFQEWFEVIRSAFSGMSKGQKFVDYSGNPLQEKDQDGHYRDTPFMFVLEACSGVLFSLTLGLRALARGFGRSPLGQADIIISKPTKTVASVESSVPKSEPVEEPLKREKSSAESLTLSKLSNGLHSFFKPERKKSDLVHSKSEVSLDSATEPASIIRDLV